MLKSGSGRGSCPATGQRCTEYWRRGGIARVYQPIHREDGVLSTPGISSKEIDAREEKGDVMMCVVRKVGTSKYIQEDGEESTRIERAKEFPDRVSALEFCRERELEHVLVVLRMNEPEGEVRVEESELT